MQGCVKKTNKMKNKIRQLVSYFNQKIDFDEQYWIMLGVDLDEFYSIYPPYSKLKIQCTHNNYSGWI